MPRVSLDYFYMSQQDEEASKNPLLVMVDEKSGEKYARLTSKKGIGTEGELTWLIKDLSEEIKTWGHMGGEGGKVILKCDGEPAMKAVRDALGRYHGGVIIPESPAVNESQSNGTAEEAGKTVREFVRVLKDQIEYHTKEDIGSMDVVVLWMVRWAAMLVSRFLKSKDGKTPYESRRGRKCEILVVPFGEVVWYKRIREGKDRKDKLTSEWEEGIWLGHTRNTNEAIIGTDECAVKAYSIERKPLGERWDIERIKRLRGTPQRPNPDKQSIEVPARVNFDGPDEVEVEPAQNARDTLDIRRMRISPAILRKYGFTTGCEGCRYKRAGFKESRGHNEECRNRLYQRMSEDPEDKEKLNIDERRITQKMADNLQDHV